MEVDVNDQRRTDANRYIDKVKFKLHLDCFASRFLLLLKQNITAA